MALAALAATARLGPNAWGQPQHGNCLPPPQGLVSWWPADGDALDVWGGNNGVLAGNGALGSGATYGPGFVGQGFVFSHPGDAVLVGNDENLQLQDFTIEAWIERASSSMATLDGQSSWAWIFSFGEMGYGFCMLHNSGELLLAQVGAYNLGSRAAVADTTFHHVAVTKSGTNVVFYVDGVAYGVGLPFARTFQFTTQAAIGAQGDTYGGSFYGTIDEMSVYNAALSASQIQAIYSAASAGKCPPGIISQPASQAVVAGDAAMFNVSAIGPPPLSYQWTFNGADINGATNASLVLPNVQTNQAGTYSVTVSYALGVAVSTGAVLTVTPFIPQPTLAITGLSQLTFTNLTIGANYQLQELRSGAWSNQSFAFTATNVTYIQEVFGIGTAGSYRLAVTPVPQQAYAAAQVVNGLVVGATVISGGSGYITPPPVSFLGGGGSNAMATAAVSGGAVTSITITASGMGYTNAPAIQIGPPPASAIAPLVAPVVRLDCSNLLPYANYQFQFVPQIGGVWSGWGGLFTPTDVANTQYAPITNSAGFYRLLYVP